METQSDSEGELQQQEQNVNQDTIQQISTPALQQVLPIKKLTKEEIGKLSSQEKADYIGSIMVAAFNAPDPE